MKKIFFTSIISCLVFNMFAQIQVGTNNCVGIGAITTPIANLDIAGTVRVANTPEADIDYIVGSNVWEAGSNNTGISVANQYYIFENTGYRLRVHRNSNIFLYTLPNDAFPWIFEKNGSDPCLYSANNYGILGKSDRPLYQIYSNYIRCNGVSVTSDERLKTNVKEMQGCLKKIRLVKGVTYDLNLKVDDTSSKLLNQTKPNAKNDTSIHINNNDSLTSQLKAKLETKRIEEIKSKNKNRIGFLAQDLKVIFPDLVQQDSTTGICSVDYIGMIPVLTNAINEQQILIEQQNSIIAVQEQNFKLVKKELEEIKKQLKKQ
jgi:hypothetical protein